MKHDYLQIIPDDLEWLYAPDQRYAARETGDLRLQILFPHRRQWQGNVRFPVVLYVPGAAWYEQEMYNSVPQWAKLAEKGCVVAAVQVRSSTQEKFPAQVEDLLDAMYHLAAEADRWHIDPHRMYLAGSSSGGHIALLTMLRSIDELAKAPEFTLRGVFTLAAPTDLSLCSEAPAMNLLGLASPEEDPARIAEASCGMYITPGRSLPKILLIHGTEDGVVSIEHTQRLYRQLKQAGKWVHMIKINGAGHGGAWQWKEHLLDSIMQFIREG